jgi:hypothetical protein
MTTKNTTQNHTPGPWYARHGQISSETSAHGCTIANCNSTARGISDSEVEANAALIASAPYLLDGADMLLLADGFIRAAIARATGDSQTEGGKL